MKPLVIYHGGCLDGFGAAYAAWKKFGDTVEFHPGIYGEAPPPIAGRLVYIVDFSYKRPMLESMAREAQAIIVLDHHKSAKEDLAGFPEPPLQVDLDDGEGFAAVAAFAQRLPIFTIFDMERSGAMITWEFFHGANTAPDLIDYIEDHDLWRKRLSCSDEVHFALTSYPMDFDVWDNLNVAGLVYEGTSIRRFFRAQMENVKKGAYTAWIAGYKVPVCNANYLFASDLANELAKTAPFAATYFENEGWVNVSLRSTAEGLDVSKIAAQFGGGGHKHAAGFRVPREKRVFAVGR